MNPPEPPPIPVPVFIPAPIRVPVLAPGERLLPTVAIAGAVVALGDFLFWSYQPGLSLGVFAVALAVLLLLRNRHAFLKARVLIPFALLLVSAVQTAISFSFTNCAVIAALFAVLMGELYFTTLPAGWARWSESIVAWLCAPGRWFWVIAAVSEQPTLRDGAGARFGDRLGRWLRIALPAAALLLLFGVVFAAGNRIFGDYLSRFATDLANWLGSFDFSVPRILFWLCFATLGLAFMRPRAAAKTVRAWACAPGEWRRAEEGVAFWQSAMVLVALNALFCAVNTIDVAYLWMHQAIPAGVVARDYLYEGIYSLITATVLAGIVLTFLFQQSENVTHSRALKWLAFAWVAQNLVLIAGVFLRLNLFLEIADMTEKRIYVACFLLLVTAGFGLLCVHISRGREAGRLIWRNALATFALFFILQFLNVADWVCRHNFERWQRTGFQGGINVGYQLNLGPDAWPALMKLADTLPPSEPRVNLILGLREIARIGTAPARNWREAQFRRDKNAATLAAWAAPHGEMSMDERTSPFIQEFYQTRRALR